MWFLAPFCFSHPQTGPIEPVPVSAPNPYQVGVMRRGRQGPQVQTQLEEKVSEMGSVVLWRAALGRDPEAWAKSCTTWGWGSLEDSLFLSLVAVLSPLSEGSY